MQDKELYEQLLGLKAPWKVSSVDLRIEESKVTVPVTHEHSAQFSCPQCGRAKLDASSGLDLVMPAAKAKR